MVVIGDPSENLFDMSDDVVESGLHGLFAVDEKCFFEVSTC